MLRRRGWLLLGFGVAIPLLIAVVALVRLPDLVRMALVWQIGSVTGRQVTIESARFDPLTGDFSVRGLRVAERDGTPFADLERLDAQISRRALLRGHLWVRDLALVNSTVRVVRHETGEFNLMDIVGRTGGGGGGGALDVTVDRFSLKRGTVTLDDRMLHPPRTWTSADITLDAHHVSTRPGPPGTAIGSTMLNGAPVSVRVDDLRLIPVHLRAVIDVKGADVSLARLYLPPETPVTLDRGRLDTRITIVHDARDGIRVGGDGRIKDAVVLRRHQHDPVMVAPEIQLAFRDLTYSDQGFALARFEASGGGTVATGDAKEQRFALSRLRAVAEAVTWPVRSPARIDFVSTVPGGGEITAKGTVQMQPPRADVQVRARGVDVGAWTRFMPSSARVTGTGDASFTVTAALGASVSATARGTAGVSRVVVTDGQQRLLAADRAEALGVEIGWPLRVAVDRVRIRQPVGVVERDAQGEFPLLAAFRAEGASGQPRAQAPPQADAQSRQVAQAPAAQPPSPTPQGPAAQAPTPQPPVTQPSMKAPSAKPAGGGPAIQLPGPIRVREIVIEDGRIGWRDAAVTPAARIDLYGVRVSVRDAVWPISGPVQVSLQARGPGGGRLTAAGPIGIDPMTAELTVTSSGLEIASAGPYLGVPARVSGRADAALDVRFSREPETKIAARGRASVSRVTVADGTRPLMTVERADVTGIDLKSLTEVSIQRVVIQRPTAVVERNERGELPLRALLTPRATQTAAAGTAPTTTASASAPPGNNGSANASASPRTDSAGNGGKLSIAVGHVSVDDGSIRFVDQTLAPPFTQDLRNLTVRVVGFGTAPAAPARFEVRGMLDGTSRLTTRGRVGPIDGPLTLDGEAELRDYQVPHVNPYLKRMVSWIARDGKLWTSVRYHIAGDELRVQNEIHLGGLTMVRAAADDPAQQKIGIPLGLVVALLKNSRGEIRLSVPIGGRLSSPELQYGDAIWDAIRAITLNTIARPLSWIGRLKMTRDSKIQDIEIDPVAFEPGSTTLAPKGVEQVDNLTGFLRSSAGVRMVLTPVITIGDLDQLRAEALRARIQQKSRERGQADLQIAQQLFDERFPGKERPKTLDDLVAALVPAEPPPADAAHRLAVKRVDAVREAIGKAGIETARLESSRDVEGLEAPQGGRVELAVTDRIRPKRGLLAELLKKLLDAIRGA